MSEAPKLKPCPFCGGAAGATKDGDYHVIMCRECMASVADRTRRTALHVWNTRTDAITPQMAAKVLLDRWATGEFENTADAAADDEITRQCEALERMDEDREVMHLDGLSIIEAWLRTIAGEGKQ